MNKQKGGKTTRGEGRQQRGNQGKSGELNTGASQQQRKGEGKPGRGEGTTAGDMQEANKQWCGHPTGHPAFPCTAPHPRKTEHQMCSPCPGSCSMCGPPGGGDGQQQQGHQVFRRRWRLGVPVQWCGRGARPHRDGSVESSTTSTATKTRSGGSGDDGGQVQWLGRRARKRTVTGVRRAVLPVRQQRPSKRRPQGRDGGGQLHPRSFSGSGYQRRIDSYFVNEVTKLRGRRLSAESWHDSNKPQHAHQRPGGVREHQEEGRDCVSAVERQQTG